MNDTVYIISAIVIIALVFYFLIKYLDNRRKAKSDENFLSNLPIVLVPTTTIYKTVKGANVSTVKPLSEDEKIKVFEAIDSGIDTLFLSVRNKGYTQFLDHSKFEIKMQPPTYFTQADKAPCITLKNGVTAAGTVLGLGQFEPPMIVVAENTTHMDFLSEASRFEGEHIVAFYNDKDVFNSHLGYADIHPIYELPSASAFAAVKIDRDIEGFNCGLGLK